MVQEKPLTKRSSPLTRGLRGAAVVATAYMCAVVPLTIVPAWAEDDRDTVAAQQAESAQHVEQLKADLTGIDSTLAQIYLDLDALRTQIPQAQEAATAAQSTAEAAARSHQVLEGQLESARAEKDRLSGEIVEAQDKHVQATAAIGGLARKMYQGGEASPIVAALTADGVQGIGERASAAEAMARTQNKAINSALDSEATQRNQEERQAAVTERIGELEAEAREAAEAAQRAADEATARVAELETLKKDADAKQAEWESKKSEAQQQLTKWQSEYEAMSERLAKIDADNLTRGVVFPGANGFASPLRVPLAVTSPFGWRYHPVLGINRFHNGTDFSANCGTPIYPIAPGVVEAVTLEEAGGNVVYVNHGLVNGASWVSAYVHMKATNVSPGQSVDRNSTLGWVGATGYATGCHLHLSLMQNGADVDPVDFL
ncbi:MAG: peptidase M23 [Actinobacteria bacterium]|nr:MAG: peptidase M23 [Actinomycetota bacterium]